MVQNLKKDTGEIIRLKFLSSPNPQEKNVKATDPNLDTFEVMINPSSIKRNLSVSMSDNRSNSSQSKGDSISCEPEVFSFDFILDGTNVVLNQKGKTVKEQIDNFLNVVYKKEGRPIQCVLIEYLGSAFKVHTNSINILYNLFNRDGEPLRAILSCVFSTIQSVNPRKSKRSRKTKTVIQESLNISVLQQENINNACCSSVDNSSYTNNVPAAVDTARKNNCCSLRTTTTSQNIEYKKVTIHHY